MNISMRLRTATAVSLAIVPLASTMLAGPAHAQFGGIVYDPTNYAQNQPSFCSPPYVLEQAGGGHRVASMTVRLPMTARSWEQ